MFASSMYLSHAHAWLRYIDDVFMVWTGTQEELISFMEELNNNTRNIHLTYVVVCEIPFRDLQNRQC